MEGVVDPLCLGHFDESLQRRDATFLMGEELCIKYFDSVCVLYQCSWVALEITCFSDVEMPKSNTSIRGA